MAKGSKNASELDFTILSNKEAMLQAFAQIDAEKGQEYPLIIGGRRVMTDEKITSIAPATKEVLGKVSSCSKELADEAIRSAHEAFKTWSKVPVEERICCVRRLVELMHRERYILDAWSVEESGKNWGEADGELCEAL
ncbi:MAG TPA: L-glutamate gamma-semialdehyde dehydrogenase, partial [Lachnospiraceae bacterium]|nr:L-glutamate gamma-semialdehyde dehydrogenase [Lachnospiraceae bacterium]